MANVPAHSQYGVPVHALRLAHIEGARIAPPSAPYLGRGSKCSGNDDTCEGMKAKGTDLCMGHLRSVNKTKAVTSGTDTDD